MADPPVDIQGRTPRSAGRSTLAGDFQNRPMEPIGPVGRKRYHFASKKCSPEVQSCCPCHSKL